jgi:hypothetical protein
MVLTAPEFRRRGFAESLIVRALEFAEQRNIATLGLDATESGIGLYRKHGFLEDCKIERWQRAPWPVDPGEALVYEPDPRYDQMYFGADRRRLLAQLAKLEAASVRGEGYAMGRPGFSAAYFGPCVANSPAAAQTLLRWFLGNHPRETIFWDLFPDNQEVVNIAQEFGFRPVRRLERMTFRRNRARPIANPPEIYAIAGFELG